MRVIAVTGSASGIGAAIRARLVRDGQRVDRRRPARRRGRRRSRRSPPAARPRSPRVERECGGSLDGLVACAGVGPHVADQALIVSLNYFGAQATARGPARRPGARHAARRRGDLVELEHAAERRLAAGRRLPRRRRSRGAPARRVRIVGPAGLRRLEAGADALAAPQRAACGVGRRRHPTERRRAGTDPDAAAARRARRCPLRPRDPRLSRSHRRRSARRTTSPPRSPSCSAREARFCCGSVLFVDGGTDALLRADQY